MSKSILIVEDDRDIVKMTSTYLTKKGHLVRTVNNCEAIWESIEEGKPDMILMDLSIPKMGGAEATSKLKASSLTKDIEIILLSAFPGIPVIAKEIGADGYLAKPFNIQDLSDLVQNGTNHS